MRTERRIRFTQTERYVFIFFGGYCNIIKLNAPIFQGTPAFISAELLKSYMGDQPPVTRTFIHDVESLLWILVWVVAHRSQDANSWKINSHAEKLIRNLSQNDMSELGAFKSGLFQGDALALQVEGCGNKWSEALVSVIDELAQFFYLYYYRKPNYTTRGARAEQVRKYTELHDLMMEESREATFARLFRILDDHIDLLKDDGPPNFTRLY
jgi:uncharacterized protein YneF (UPF0154 family)